MAQAFASAVLLLLLWPAQVAASLGEKADLQNFLEDADLLQVHPILAHHGVVSVEPLLELTGDTMSV